MTDPYPGRTKKELAEACGVSLYTVSRWINQGHMKAYKVGPDKFHVRITEEEFARVVATMSIRAGEQETG